MQGLDVQGQRYTISQYVDDTDIFSVYMKASLQAIINCLKEFYVNTGLKVNFEKSTVFRAGNCNNLPNRLPVDTNLKWAEDKLNVLGVLVALSDVIVENYQSTLKKAEALMKVWKARRLSLLGKVNVANTLITSLFVYKMQVLDVMLTQISEALDMMLKDFIWNGRWPKLKMATESQKGEWGAEII